MLLRLGQGGELGGRREVGPGPAACIGGSLGGRLRGEVVGLGRLASGDAVGRGGELLGGDGEALRLLGLLMLLLQLLLQ